MQYKKLEEFVKKLESHCKSNQIDIYNMVEFIEDAEFLKELLLFSKFTETSYEYSYDDTDNDRYGEADTILEEGTDNIYNQKVIDKYHGFRQAIALKKDLPLDLMEILSEDKNQYVLDALVTRSDLPNSISRRIFERINSINRKLYSIEKKILAKLILKKDFFESLDKNTNFDKIRGSYSCENFTPFFKAIKNINKNMNDFTLTDVEKIYFENVKPYIDKFKSIYYDYEILDYFFTYFPEKLISKNILNDITEIFMNALVLYHISDVQYSYTSKFFKKAIKYNLNINYEELLYYAFYVIANEEVIYENGKIKPRKIPLKLNVYEDYIDRGVFWRTLSNLLSTPNINLNVVKILFEQIKNNHENLYNMMICNIIDNKTIDFTKLDSNISSKIYSYSSDDSIRKLAQRIDIPIEILKKLMKFNDPIKDINLLNNPKSDKEIIEYIYNFTEYDYIKNKAQELLSKNKQNTKTLTKTKKH